MTSQEHLIEALRNLAYTMSAVSRRIGATTNDIKMREELIDTLTSLEATFEQTLKVLAKQ